MADIHEAMVWTVSNFTDSVKPKSLEKLQKDIHWPHFYKVFPSEKAAWDFVLDRANRGIDDASNNLRLAKLRMNRCAKKRSHAHAEPHG